MADDVYQRLREVTRDVWTDPVTVARHVAEAILTLLDGNWDEGDKEEIAELRRRRADSPFLLAVTEAALDSAPARARIALSGLMTQLDDQAWAGEVALRISSFASIGIVSLGETTLTVLESARSRGGNSAVLFTDRRAISRGLAYLGQKIEVAPPEQAGAVLLPAAAIIGSRLWTTARAADIALRTRLHQGEVVVVAHPLAVLNPRNRADFRPSSELVDVKI